MSKIVLAPSEANLRKAYKEADDKQKKLLANLYPDLLNPRPPMEWVNTFELLCQAAGVDEADYALPETGVPSVMVGKVLDIMWLYAKVFNTGRKAKPGDTLYWPYHDLIADEAAPRGFWLAFIGCHYDRGYACLGARPAILDKEAAIHLGTKFDFLCKELYYWSLMASNQ